MPGSIVILAPAEGSFRLAYLTREGQGIFHGVSKADKGQVLEDAAALRRAVSEDGRYAVSRDTNGWFFFQFLGDSGEKLGASESYPTPEGLGLAIAALKRGAPGAPLRDLT